LISFGGGGRGVFKQTVGGGKKTNKEISAGVTEGKKTVMTLLRGERNAYLISRVSACEASGGRNRV
jgi:hypothetical protein